MTPLIKEMTRERGGHTMGGTQGEKSIRNPLIVKEAEHITQEMAKDRVMATREKEEEEVDNHTGSHKTTKETLMVITEKVVTHQDTTEIKPHPTQTMKHQMEVVVKEVGIEIVTVACLEIVEDQDHQAQVVTRIGDLKGIEEEGEIEEEVEIETQWIGKRL